MYCTSTPGIPFTASCRAVIVILSGTVVANKFSSALLFDNIFVWSPKNTCVVEVSVGVRALNVNVPILVGVRVGNEFRTFILKTIEPVVKVGLLIVTAPLGVNPASVVASLVESYNKTTSTFDKVLEFGLRLISKFMS